MRLPHIFDSGIAMILYSMLAFIIVTGLWQFFRQRYRSQTAPVIKNRSLVPVGAAAATFGFIGLYLQWSDAFEAIEMAGDISPAIVASAMREGVSYPTFGFLILAITFIFRFVNQ